LDQVISLLVEWFASLSDPRTLYGCLHTVDTMSTSHDYTQHGQSRMRHVRGRQVDIEWAKSVGWDTFIARPSRHCSYGFVDEAESGKWRVEGPSRNILQRH